MTILGHADYWWRLSSPVRKDGNLMIKALKDHPTYTFILKTLFYFVVLVALIYLYGYFGAGQAPFIYNEF